MCTWTFISIVCLWGFSWEGRLLLLHNLAEVEHGMEPVVHHLDGCEEDGHHCRIHTRYHQAGREGLGEKKRWISECSFECSCTACNISATVVRSTAEWHLPIRDEQWTEKVTVFCLILLKRELKRHEVLLTRCCYTWTLFNVSDCVFFTCTLLFSLRLFFLFLLQLRLGVNVNTLNKLGLTDLFDCFVLLNVLHARKKV